MNRGTGTEQEPIRLPRAEDVRWWRHQLHCASLDPRAPRGCDCGLRDFYQQLKAMDDGK